MFSRFLQLQQSAISLPFSTSANVPVRCNRTNFLNYCTVKRKGRTIRKIDAHFDITLSKAIILYVNGNSVALTSILRALT